MQTDRFFLRSFTERDVNAGYGKWFEDPLVGKYIVSSSSLNNIEALKDYVRRREGLNDVWFCGVFERNTMSHIANIKYEPIDYENSCAVMGILIGRPEWRGCGLAKEVVLSTAKWLRDCRGIDSIYLAVMESNRMAVDAYYKMGFTFDDTGYISAEIGAIAMCLKTKNIN